MPSLASLFVFASLACAAFAAPRAEPASHMRRDPRVLDVSHPVKRDATCASPAVVATSTAVVDGGTVLLETLACPALSADGLFGGLLCFLFHIDCPKFKPPPPHSPPPPGTVTATVTDTVTATATFSATAPAPTTLDVSGAPCNTFCSTNIGRLPPIQEDCDTISNSLTIFEGKLNSPSFTVDPGHIFQLTFGTCRWTFQNTANPATLSYSWTELNATAVHDGLSCFPPVQPLNSIGLCVSTDDTWAVGSSHS